MPKKQRKAIEVAIDQTLERVRVADALHPEGGEELLFYRNYSIAYAYRPDEHLPCPLCMKEKPGAPRYIKDTQMSAHCRTKHPKAEAQCEYDNCTVKFEDPDQKEKHYRYVHLKTYGWWM